MKEEFSILVNSDPISSAKIYETASYLLEYMLHIKDQVLLKIGSPISQEIVKKNFIMQVHTCIYIMITP